MASINNIQNELVIGLIGSLGVDFDEVAKRLHEALQKAGYSSTTIRIAENFMERDNPSKFAEYYWKMQYATKYRQTYGNTYWARQAVEYIFNLRPKLSQKNTKIAYIIRSLKNKQELDLLRDVYDRNFIAISVFTEEDASVEYLTNKLALHKLKTQEASAQMQQINRELNLQDDVSITDTSLAKFLLNKDQEETHPQLKMVGQNLFKCYSDANYFIYQNRNLARQIARFVDLLFNDPFAEPTYEEYFMFCAQAAAYRSLDLDRQIGAVIVNPENEMVASGFNDVSKVGGGHFPHHDHPIFEQAATVVDHRDFKQESDFNHKYLDQIADNLADKLDLSVSEREVMREEIRAVTEFKRSTHAEMSALLDAARRGVSVRDCTIYVNTYPCHNCTKHIIAAGIRKVVFLHPYAKSKAREMYKSMLWHGLTGLLNEKHRDGVVVFEPFLGISPNRFSTTFANDKETRLEVENGRENGKPIKWALTNQAIPRDLINRRPYCYIPREWALLNDRNPDMRIFYNDLKN